MKIAAFSCREDELEFFRYFGERYQVELVLSKEAPSMKNVDLVEGCQAVSIITTSVNSELIDAWGTYGIQVISTRTIGYEHIDHQYAAQAGIVVSNVSYSANTVAEYTVMSMLMAIRRMKTIISRYQNQDYSLRQIRGKELQHMTVGVIGTGKIGETVIHNVSGFGCSVLAFDKYQKESVTQHARYVTLEQIWQECDLITLHTPATAETFHLVNEETIAKMKKGVILINTARGSLIDTRALIQGLESGQVGAAALDVIEDEMNIYYRDFKYQPVGHHDMAILNAMPNVLMTPHTAFFTDEAVSDMIEFSISSCIKTLRGEENPWKIN